MTQNAETGAQVKETLSAHALFDEALALRFAERR
jgi:hypothetical protein